MSRSSQRGDKATFCQTWGYESVWCPQGAGVEGSKREARKEWVSIGRTLNAKLKSLDLRLLWVTESLWKSQPRLEGSLHFKLLYRMEDPLEKEMATHSSILAWEIPWMEEPGGLQSMGSQRIGQLRDFTHIG